MSLAGGEEGHAVGKVGLEVGGLLVRLEGRLVIVDFKEHDTRAVLWIHQNVKLTAAGFHARIGRVLYGVRQKRLHVLRLDYEVYG